MFIMFISRLFNINTIIGVEIYFGAIIDCKQNEWLESWFTAKLTVKIAFLDWFYI